MVSASYLLSRRLTERRFNEIRLTDCSLYKVITDAYQMKSRRQTESISFALIIHLCWDKALHRTQQALSVYARKCYPLTVNLAKTVAVI